MLLSRRQAILRTLFGSSGLGLVSLATGIPAAILANPRRALAAGVPSDACPTVTNATFLILSTSSSGDPINGNVPGTYEDAGIVHPAAATMAATPMTVGGKQVNAAAPWAGMDPSVIAKTAFFHHSTNTVVHGDESQTLKLDNTVANNEMLVSLLASQLGPCLGTIQPQPIVVGASNSGESITYKGRTQPLLQPQSLASVLTLPNGPLKDLRTLRDQTVDALNAWYKSNATPGQADFLTRYAQSQTELRNVSDTLLNNLSSIKDNGVASQILASVALVQLNVAPVVSMHIPFGGDNHGDNGLASEAAQTVAGVASISSLQTQLKAANLDSKVTFMNLNVFGRTMAVSHKGQNGRDHNGNHHATVIIGPRVKSSIVGGVVPGGGDYTATGIDSASGASNASGDIPFAETFAAMGKTVGAACGLTSAYLDANITGGKVVAGAVA